MTLTNSVWAASSAQLFPVTKECSVLRKAIASRLPLDSFSFVVVSKK